MKDEYDFSDAKRGAVAGPDTKFEHAPRKWLFLDFDEVISTYRYAASIGETGGLRTSWDPTALNLIQEAIRGHDVHLVISSVWRYTIAKWDHNYFWRRFRQNGFQELGMAFKRSVNLTPPEYRDDVTVGEEGLWSTGLPMNTHGKCDRSAEVDRFIRENCSENDIVCVIDDTKLELKTTTGFVWVSTPYDGMSVHNYLAMRDIFNGVPNVTIQPKQEQI